MRWLGEDSVPPLEAHPWTCAAQLPASELFVGGKVIYSMEGTTQGDPLAMPMYAVASVPPIDRLETANSGARQLWFADDSSNAGKLTTLKV